MSALVYSSSLIAAFLGGVLALFAPCCVVSLLPTFVGAALERGRMRLPAMAAIFAAGIASVMLPIVLGVGLLGQLLAAQHRVIFFVVGLFLVLLALQVASGRPWSLPFPMLRLRVSGSTPGGIFALGLTAGVASSCCAPVLAGVVALSALASSVTGALGLGLAYVFGIVFPLLVTVLVGIGCTPAHVASHYERVASGFGDGRYRGPTLLPRSCFSPSVFLLWSSRTSARAPTSRAGWRCGTVGRPAWPVTSRFGSGACRPRSRRSR